MPDRPKVGEILVQAGVIDKFQLQAALGEQARWGRRLGVTLIKLGFVEELDLVRALASQLDLPVARLEGKRIQPEILELVPMALAEQHMVVPLFVKKQAGSQTLFLGMEDPSNLAVLDDLTFRTGMEVRPVMVGPSEIAEAIDRYYRRAPAPESAPTPPAPLAPSADLSNDLQDEGESTAPMGVPPALAPTPAPVAATIPSGTEELARHWTLAADDENETTQPEQAPEPGLLESAPAGPEPAQALAPPPLATPVAAPAAAPEVAEPALSLEDDLSLPLGDEVTPPLAAAPTAPAPAAPFAPSQPVGSPEIDLSPQVDLDLGPPADLDLTPPAAIDLAAIAAAETDPGIAPLPPVPAPPAPPVADPVATPPAAASASPTAQPAPPPSAEVPQTAAEARMRLILKALSQILIEKGIMTREELQARVREIEHSMNDQG
jgi:type IV pilus assembly protein PilB